MNHGPKDQCKDSNSQYKLSDLAENNIHREIMWPTIY